MGTQTPSTTATNSTAAQKPETANPFIGALDGLKPAKRERRRPGRPRTDERPITPEILERISDMWIRGYSLGEIAKQIHVTKRCVAYHVKRHAVPTIEANINSSAKLEVARLDALQAEAWRAYRDHRPVEKIVETKEAIDRENGKVKLRSIIQRHGGQRSAWLQLVLSCIQERARILGLYPPTGFNVRLDHEVRVAGGDLGELSETLVSGLIERIEERRKHEAVIRRFSNN